ncbi:family 1 glycosylhydrolase, partial [Bacillus pumilus]
MKKLEKRFRKGLLWGGAVGGKEIEGGYNKDGKGLWT